jgi:hypothetical protein
MNFTLAILAIAQIGIDIWDTFCCQISTPFHERILGMKDSEELAFQYLSSLGFVDIEYEPDGNVPPDFLVNGMTAVEVRRLNQHYIDETGVSVGLEKDRFRLHLCIKQVLKSLGPPVSGRSWFVMYDFQRPLPPLKQVRKSIAEALTNFRDGIIKEQTYMICKSINLSVFPSSKIFSDCFVIGGSMDGNSGGWLGRMLQENIDICVREKTNKIAHFRNRYEAWWLVLIDHIGYGSIEPLNVAHDWDKIIILNSQNPLQAYTI